MAVKHGAATVFNGRQHREATVAAAISEAILALNRTYYGREPAQVKTFIDGHFVCCVLEEPFTSFEKVLLSDVDNRMSVREIWQSYQDAMADRFKQVIAEITDCDVVAFLSQAHADPDLVVLLFQLAAD